MGIPKPNVHYTRIVFSLYKPKNWKAETFEELLADIEDYCGAKEVRYDRRFDNEPAEIVFYSKSRKDSRRILTEYSHQNANQWKMRCNRKLRKRSC